MGRSSIPRWGSASKLGRNRAVWLAAAVASALLFVACGGTDSDMATDAVAFTATGTEMPAGTEMGEAARSADAAPDFELVLFETPNHVKGEVIRLSQFGGKPVVINHWFPSCPPCVAEMPDLEAAFQRHKDNGVQFIGVQNLGLDTEADGQDFLTEIGVTYAVGPDNNPNNDKSIFIQYKVTGFPTTLFLDKNHEVVRKWTGLLDAAKIEELIQELLK